MSDQPVGQRSLEEEIEALRKDMAATSAERDASSRRAAMSAAELKHELARRERAEAEIAKLEKAAQDRERPHDLLLEGLQSIRKAFQRPGVNKGRQ